MPRAAGADEKRAPGHPRGRESQRPDDLPAGGGAQADADEQRHRPDRGRARADRRVVQGGGEDAVGGPAVAAPPARRSVPGNMRRVQLHGRRAALAHADVEHFDAQRERHGEVDKALGHVVFEALGHQHHADHDQEGQRQHLDGRVVRHEAADRPGEQHHQPDRCDHRGDHHAHVVHHAHGGDDRVERKHQVDDHDLQDDRGKGGLHDAGRVVFGAFHGLVDLGGALPDQEQAAQDQDQVAPGDLHAEHAEQRRHQSDDPGQHQQQADAHEHRHEKPEAPRKLALFLRQLVHQDRDEDDVVDAQHQFEQGQRGKGDPGLGVGQKFNHGGPLAPCGGGWGASAGRRSATAHVNRRALCPCTLTGISVPAVAQALRSGALNHHLDGQRGDQGQQFRLEGGQLRAPWRWASSSTRTGPSPMACTCGRASRGSASASPTWSTSACTTAPVASVRNSGL